METINIRLTEKQIEMLKADKMVRVDEYIDIECDNCFESKTIEIQVWKSNQVVYLITMPGGGKVSAQ